MYNSCHDSGKLFRPQSCIMHLIEYELLLFCRAGAIHGDMDQHSRMSVLAAFKSGRHHVLVATDVAARGLDIKSIKSVVNYDTAKDIDTHVHRVGRTGRAGDKEGMAHTLITPREIKFAGGASALMPDVGEGAKRAGLSALAF